MQIQCNSEWRPWRYVTIILVIRALCTAGAETSRTSERHVGNILHTAGTGTGGGGGGSRVLDWPAYNLYQQSLQAVVRDGKIKYMPAVTMADEDIEEKDDSTLARKLNDILKAKGRAGDADGVKDHHRQKRKLHTPLKKWNKARIYYQISKWPGYNYTRDEEQIIRQAFLHWEDATCLKFRESDFIPYNEPYIMVLSSDSCASSIGRIKESGAQAISINRYKCIRMGIIAHEIGHTFGFHHEHSRVDRNSRVKVHWKNMMRGYESQFTIQPTLLYHPYDYGSVMHYNPWGFSARGDHVLDALDPVLTRLMGQRAALSFYDIYLANKLYQCSENCPATAPKCENEGFLLENCTCYCPDGLGGRTCGQVVSSPGCGGVITVTDGSVEVKSVNYPNSYPQNKVCTWLIKTTEDKALQVNFNDFDIAYHRINITCRDTLEVRYFAIGTLGGRYCGTNIRTGFTSSTNLMLLRFTSHQTGSERGFKASVSATSKPVCPDFPCENGGACYTIGLSFSCQCPYTYYGFRCQHSTDDPGPRPAGWKPPVAPRTEIFWSCDFEGNTNDPWCGITNVGSTDSFAWSRRDKETPTWFTGPKEAYSKKYFSHIEGNGRRNGDNATMVIPTKGLRGASCFTFFYHMYGKDIGTLQADIETGGKKVSWSKSGELGQQWQRAEIDFVASEPLKVSLTGVVGPGKLCDIAVDFMFILNRTCGATTTTTMTTRSTPAPSTTRSTATPTPWPQVKGSYWRCDFEEDMCGMVQNETDSLDWLLMRAPASPPGPLAARSGNFFMFAGGFGSKAGSKGRFANVDWTGPSCVIFYYHMNGAGIGALAVQVFQPSNGGKKSILWTNSVSRGDTWLLKTLDVSLQQFTTVSFVGVQGYGTFTVIAVDSPMLAQGTCSDVMNSTSSTPTITTGKILASSRPPTTPPVPSSMSSSGPSATRGPVIWKCDFEGPNGTGSFCGLQHHNMSDLDWRLHSGRTPTDNTGPSQAASGLYYIYVEASSRPFGHKAYLKFPSLGFVGGVCFSFKVHQYGEHMGALIFYLRQGDKATVQWQRSGSYGNQWETKRVDLTLTADMQLAFVAVLMGYYGDVSVDDMMITEGDCNGQGGQGTTSAATTTKTSTSTTATSAPSPTTTTTSPVSLTSSSQTSLTSTSAGLTRPTGTVRGSTPSTTRDFASGTNRHTSSGSIAILLISISTVITITI